ncbi:MAG: efflux RND transporter periplasmic adaptor subunit [Candidatus Binatia bacterium]|nr:efflux RND transporter periplasmic adaptor subunit [Candidatus Binatia bacterium]
MSAEHTRWVSPRLLGAVGSIVGLAVLLLYLSGAIGGHKVEPGTRPLPPAVLEGTDSVVTVREVPDIIDWPGAVRSRLVANVAPRVLARVAEVHVRMGSPVKVGEPLVTLDAAELAAKREQARAALAAAEAEAQHAAQEERRVRGLFEQNAATKQDLDAIIARSRAASAALQRARDALAEAEVAVSETVLRAPFDGVIASRWADPGDLAVPGQPLVVVHDPATLRFEAAIGESCSAALALGATLRVRLDQPAEELLARLEEISPQAEPTTRTVRVKLGLPEAPEVRPGAYGVVRVPCGQHQAALVPIAALQRRGQLEFVYVRTDGGVVMRQVRSGKTYGDQVEILSGVARGERVVIPRKAQG